MSKQVTFPAILAKAETKADRSIKLIFETRELGRDGAELFALAHSEGWLVFSPQEITEVDLPDEKPDAMTSTKTKAQRLRATLFVLWKQRGENGDFESFYNTNMERIIEQVKDRLE